MSHSARRVAISFVTICALAWMGQGRGAAAGPPKGVRSAATTAEKPPDYGAILKTLRFREIGPAVMGGRIDDFAVVESHPDTIYAGTASGGLFKTDNGGITWRSLFDDEAVSSIGDVSVAPSDPSQVWVGTGEANNRQSSSWGNGVYRSTDGGKTWKHVGLDATHHIGRIVIHPSDPNTVYVAALGRLWGPSKERGLYKTTDGGKSWSQVLFIDEDTGVTDVAIDHESPGTLIAAAYQRRRSVFGFNGSGPHGGLYKTTDGGASWRKLEEGLPWDPSPRPSPPAEGAQAQAQPRPSPSPSLSPEAMKEIGRIGVSFYRRDSHIVYALIEHAGGGLFRSEDKGETWTKMSDTNPRGIYYSQVHIDPSNDQRIWVHGAAMYYSEDGGRTFRTNLVQRIHGDYHAMWIDPRDSDHMIVGSDGGIYLSRDRGRTWDAVSNISLAQFYEIGLDMAKPYHVCGGLQDNNTWCGPSAVLEPRGIPNSAWFTVGGGDGFYAQIDPTDPNIVYAESQDGNLLRRDLRTHESRSIRPQPAESEPRYRFQWNSPVVISAHDPRTIYYGANFLFRSPDRGDRWTRISPDLTTNQRRDELPIMGKVPDRYTRSRHDGVQQWPAITTISESARNKDVLWVGTDDGNLQVTRDGGQAWRNVADRVKGVPKGTYVSRVVASRHAEGTAYATFDGHRSNDFGIYVYMTADYGETWRAIKDGIPDDNGVVHVIREHHRNPRLLFAGTEHGLYVTFDQGARWTRLKLNLPTVPVDDIAIHPRENDLVLATHGRSVWILDDITPLERLSDGLAGGDDLHVFDPRPATQWRIAARGGTGGHKVFLGDNPPNGALLHYYLKSKPDEKERVRIAITDQDGKTVRELEGRKEAGLNRVVWDLRSRPPQEAPTDPAGAGAGGEAGEVGEAGEALGGPGLGGGRGGFGAGGGALRVEPGEYTVTVKLGKIERSRKVVVEEDPRISITAEDRAARRQALKQVSELAAAAARDQRAVTGLRTSLGNLVEGWKRPAAIRPPENVQKAAEELLQKVEESCRKLANPVQCGERPATALGAAGPPLLVTDPPLTQRINQLRGALEGYTAAPTVWQLEQIKFLQVKLAEASPPARKLVQEDLAALNKLMNEAGVPHITAPRGARAAESASAPEAEAPPEEEEMRDP